MIACQSQRKKQELVKVIEAKLSAKLSLASIMQHPSEVNFEVMERLLLSRINKLAQELPEIDNLVCMATKVNQRALDEILLQNARHKLLSSPKSSNSKVTPQD